VEVEQLAEEAVDDEEVLAPVRERLGVRLGLLETFEQVGDVVAKRCAGARVRRSGKSSTLGRQCRPRHRGGRRLTIKETLDLARIPETAPA
jgi:hypothetical protein